MTTSVADSSANPPYSIDFEDLPPGSIDGLRGWRVEQGKADVVAGKAHDGKQSMRLISGDPFSQAKLTLQAAVPPSTVTFVDFWVLPVAGPHREGGELLDIDGARIGFFQAADDPLMAEFWVVDGNGRGGGTWIKTNLRVAVSKEERTPTTWQHITLREDFTRQVWDLKVDGRLLGANLGFQDANIGHTENYIIMGDAAESVFLDDLLIQNENPLGLDSDYDGFTNTEEKELGWQPYFDDRDVVVEGITKVERLVATGKNVVGEVAVTPPDPPSFSHPSGRHADPIALSLQAAGRKILYTMDGSDPRSAPQGAHAFTESISLQTTTVIRAISIDARGRLSATATGAWIFPAKVVDQPNPSGIPAEFIDQSFWHGSMGHFRIPWTLQAGTGSPAAIANSLASAPIALLAVDPQSMFSNDQGAYARSSVRGLVVKGDLVCISKTGAVTTVPTAVTVSGQSSNSEA